MRRSAEWPGRSVALATLVLATIRMLTVAPKFETVALLLAVLAAVLAVWAPTFDFARACRVCALLFVSHWQLLESSSEARRPSAFNPMR